MSSNYDRAQAALRDRRRVWLVTGAAGFIGSNLVERLLRLDQDVVGLDNFATGHQRNLDEVAAAVGPERWQRLRFARGDIRDLTTCQQATAGCDVVLHHAALGSVPRSVEDPLTSNAVNVDGFLNVLTAARDARVDRFVYAASSSTYGDHPALPKVEARIGAPLSPYAVTKYVNELYAAVFAGAYGTEVIGLRYFNVFGPRQDPSGGYAAVIPKWTAALLAGDDVLVNGDGETSRDFCFVDNAVQANILAAVAPGEACNEVYNVAVGDRTSLNQLLDALKDVLQVQGLATGSRVVYGDFRPGDVRHSAADIGKARQLLGYDPTVRVRAGLEAAVPWYLQHFGLAGPQASAAAE